MVRHWLRTGEQNRFEPTPKLMERREATSCFLGGFEGKRNGYFTLEWNVKKDAGRLKELHPRVQIVKNPGYWCWL